jgi:2-ketoarginine methyltransferase
VIQTTADATAEATVTSESVDAGFEQRLIEGVRPISEHFLAMALHHLFDTGLYDCLEQESHSTVQSLATALDLDADRLEGFLRYLANEGVVHWDEEEVSLGDKGRLYASARPWYTMLIGGYASTVAQMGHALRRDAPSCTRDGRYVGMGSCEISRFDGMPITRNLLGSVGASCRELLDLGCGNGLYLTELCHTMPGLRAWGAEPDVGGYRDAIALVSSTGMNDRVHLANCSANEFLEDPPPGCQPDLVVFGYVLHEILGQQGDDAVVELLRNVVRRFPDINVVVIEVAAEIDNSSVMRHGLARNYWNPYYLLHYFTRQRLEKEPFWDALFTRAGLRTLARATTDRRVDSTGVELGYLLRGAG